MVENIFWDRKISVKEARNILKDDLNKKFFDIAAILFARTNEPKKVFSQYMNKIIFCKNWQTIKRKMRKNKWNDNRIIYWDTVYKVMIRGIDKTKIEKKEKTKNKAKLETLEIGTTIKKARKRLKWTQKKLSNETGLSQQTISSIENGNLNFSIDTLIRVVKTLRLKISIQSDNYNIMTYGSYTEGI